MGEAHPTRSVAAVVVSGGLLTFFLLYLKLNASVAMYLTLPVAFPIIAVGFKKVHGIPLGEYLKRKKKVQQQSSFFYKPEMVFWQNQGLRDSADMDSDERDAGEKEIQEKRSKAPRKKDIRKFYMETEETILEMEKCTEKKAGTRKTECSETECRETEIEVTSIEGNEGIQGADTAVVPVAEKTVQQLIPISRISKDGICQLEEKPEGAEVLFDKAYLFLDTNFATMDDLEKDDFLRRYCLMLNSLNVSFKILMINNNQDMDQVRKDVFIREKDGKFSEMIQSFNKYMNMFSKPTNVNTKNHCTKSLARRLA